MITIKNFLECIEYRVTEGSEFRWNCYGPNVRCMEYQSKEGHDANSILILFDTVNQTVYEMQAWDYNNSREYRWIHPEYVDAYKKESKNRKFSWKKSVDERKFINLDVAEDILEKSKAIFLGKEYDTRTMITLEFDDAELFLLMKMAHDADMTLNKFIEHILRKEMNKISATN